EPQIGQIKLIHKYVDHTDRIVFANPIFKTFREQCALVAVRSLNKALHFRSLRKPRRNHNPRITSLSAFLHNQDPLRTFIKSGQVLKVAHGPEARVNLEDYTPGAICRSLGLGEFQTIWKRGLPKQEFKGRLCPAFHPDLCLVFGEEDRQTQGRATCPQSQIWALPSLAPVATATNTGSFSEPTLPQLEQAFREALMQPDKR